VVLGRVRPRLEQAEGNLHVAAIGSLHQGCPAMIILRVHVGTGRE